MVKRLPRSPVIGGSRESGAEGKGGGASEAVPQGCAGDASSPQTTHRDGTRFELVCGGRQQCGGRGGLS